MLQKTGRSLSSKNMTNQKKFIIVTGPSGVGKSTLVEKIVLALPQLRDVISCTTRAQRHGESQAKPYYFLSREDFKQKIQLGYFIEWAKVYDEFYGVPQEELTKIWTQSLTPIMDIDIQGAKTLKHNFPQALAIFIAPPNLQSLHKRIIERGSVPKDLPKRLKIAKQELALQDTFDTKIINDSLVTCYAMFNTQVTQYLAATL